MLESMLAQFAAADLSRIPDLDPEWFRGRGDDHEPEWVMQSMQDAIVELHRWCEDVLAVQPSEQPAGLLLILGGDH